MALDAVLLAEVEELLLAEALVDEPLLESLLLELDCVELLELMVAVCAELALELALEARGPSACFGAKAPNAMAAIRPMTTSTSTTMTTIRARFDFFPCGEGWVGRWKPSGLGPSGVTG